MSSVARRARSDYRADDVAVGQTPTHEGQEVARVDGPRRDVDPRDQLDRAVEAPALRDLVEHGLRAGPVPEHPEKEEAPAGRGRRGPATPEPEGDGQAVGDEGGDAHRNRPQAHLAGQDRRLLGGHDQPPAVDHQLHVAEALPLERGREGAQEPPGEPSIGRISSMKSA